MSDSRDSIEILFQQHHPALKSYLYRMTASEETADDLASETFVRVINHFDSFEGRSSIKTWIFSIATNLARDHFRAQRRWVVDAQDQAKRSSSARVLLEDIHDHQQANPEVRFELVEHVDFCFTCMMKTLPLEEHVALMLSHIYDFQVNEIAQIIDKSEAVVKHLLHQARSTLRTIFEQRYALINRNGVCYQCTELNGIFNPRQQNHEELMKLKMVQAAQRDSVNQSTLLDLRLELIRNIDLFGGKSAALHLSHMRMLRAAIHDT